MKIPKRVSRFCSHCKKHTEHKISIGKTGIRRGTMTAGQRRHERRSGVHGYGGSPKPKLPEKSKTSRRTPIIYECTVCSKKHHRQYNIRAKKLAQV